MEDERFLGQGLKEAILQTLKEQGSTRVKFMRKVREEKPEKSVAVERLMNGKSWNPRMTTVMAVCKGLDVKLDDLLEKAGLFFKDDPADPIALWLFRKLPPHRHDLANGQVEALIKPLEKFDQE